MATQTQIKLPTDVDVVFDGYGKSVRPAMARLRTLVREVAKDNPQIGELIETLKWGQPAYLPKQPRMGTTVRMDVVSEAPPRVALYFHCQTTLVETFQALYPDVLSFEGNRAVVLDAAKPLPEDELGHCIGMALTYHAAKRANSRVGAATGR